MDTKEIAEYVDETLTKLYKELLNINLTEY